jgi:hypothetical protein
VEHPTGTSACTPAVRTSSSIAVQRSALCPSGVLQLRLLQEAIKREEDSLAEEHRREIQARAEADEAAKVAYYEAKQRLREQRLQQVNYVMQCIAVCCCTDCATPPCDGDLQQGHRAFQ